MAGYFRKGNERTGMVIAKSQVEPREKVEDILKYPFAEAKDRGIREEVCRKFGIRVGLSERWKDRRSLLLPVL